MSFLTELKRRNVIRMAGLYLVGAWLITQVAGTILPMFGAPEWIARSVVLLLAIGFVPALIFAWVFELTPDGIKRDAEVASADSIAPQTARRMERVIIALLMASLLVFGVDKFVFAPQRQAAAVASDRQARSAPAPSNAVPAGLAAATTAPRKSIAVLPFENLSEDKANGYFADGIQDQILTGLARIGDLKVISRTSTQKYASRPDNLSTIGRELGVASILEGSVQRSGNRVRINVQLIEAATDSHLWAETYDRKLDDVFAVETEVATMIAEALAVNLSRGERDALARKITDVPAAHDAYLKARALNNRAVVQSREQADVVLNAYREAIRLDPKFTIALAQFAREAYRTRWTGLDPTGDLTREATQALARATALDPNEPQVEMARAVGMYYIDLDFAGALAVMNGLKSKLPNDASVWMFAGYLSRRLGKFDESVTDFERARDLSPNDANIAYHLGVTRIVAGDCDRGVRDLDASLALAPDNTHALGQKLLCAWAAGNLAQASSWLAAERGTSPEVQGLSGMNLALKRDYPAAAKAFRDAIARSTDVRIDSFLGGYLPARLEWQLQLAMICTRMGDTAQAAAINRQVRDEALAALGAKIDNRYVEASWNSALGLALAGLGEREAAAAAGRRAMALAPESADSLEGPGWTYQMARIYALNGDAAQALPVIRHLLQTRAALFTVSALRLDPMFDAIRDDPGVQALLTSGGAP